jgi:hypothetical protein
MTPSTLCFPAAGTTPDRPDIQPAGGRVEIVLKQLTLRFGPLAEAVQTRVRGAPDPQIDAAAERVLLAQTLEEALARLTVAYYLVRNCGYDAHRYDDFHQSSTSRRFIWTKQC